MSFETCRRTSTICPRLVLGFALIWASTASAKDPCRSVKTTTDSFGDVVRGAVVFQSYNLFSMGVTARNEDPTLNTRWGVFAVVDNPVASGSALELKLKDGTDLRLATEALAPPQVSKWNSDVTTQWYVDGSVDPETLEALAHSEVKAARLQVGGELQTQDVPQRMARQVKTTAMCLVSARGLPFKPVDDDGPPGG